MASIVMYLESDLRTILSTKFSEDEVDAIIQNGGPLDNANIGRFKTNNSDAHPTYLDNNRIYYFLRTGNEDSPNFQLKKNDGTILANVNGKVPPRND